MQAKIQQLKQLRAEIQSLSIPTLTDTDKIPELHNRFMDVHKATEPSCLSTRNKYLFIAAIIMLYSPMSFVGRRIPEGVRTPLAKCLGYNSPEAISVATKRIVSDYQIYAKYRNEIDKLCQQFILLLQSQM